MGLIERHRYLNNYPPTRYRSRIMIKYPVAIAHCPENVNSGPYGGMNHRAQYNIFDTDIPNTYCSVSFCQDVKSYEVRGRRQAATEGACLVLFPQIVSVVSPIKVPVLVTPSGHTEIDLFPIFESVKGHDTFRWVSFAEVGGQR